MIIGDKIVTKNITIRNITKVKTLGIKKMGVYDFIASELFELNVAHDYECLCDLCNSPYILHWGNYMSKSRRVRNKSDHSDHIKFCQTCRHKIASEKMTITTRTDEHRNKKRIEAERQLCNPEIVSNRMIALEKKKNGWLKSEECKIIARKNLKHFYGEDHPNWNPNKDEYYEYRNLVRKAQNKWCLSLIPNYDENIRSLSGVDNGFQLDHIISQKYGFENKIDPYFIGHICNLQFITWQQNIKKFDKVSEESFQDIMNIIKKIDNCVYID
jgi:hypothetical protein